HRHHDRAKPSGCAVDGGFGDGHPSRAKLIDVLHHDDADLDRHAKQSQKAHTRGDADVCARYEQCQKTAQGSDSHIHEIQRGPFARAEWRIDDHEDQEYSYRHNTHQPGLRPLLTFVFAFPLDVVTTWKLNLFVHFVDRLFEGATEIPAAHTEPGR